jgi:hypothetical protein
MKILLSGTRNPAFEAIPEALAAALAGLGHRVVFFDHRSFLFPGRLRARSSRLDRLDRRLLNERFVRLVRRERPELVLVNQGMVLTAGALGGARDLGARCVNWFSDFPAEFEAGMERAEAYDAFYLASSWAAARHRERGHRGAAWLPFGCDPRGRRPLPELPAPRVPAGAAPVVFVGSWYPERQVLLRYLRGLPVSVWGPGWERAASDPQLRGMLRGGALRGSGWRALYAAARVALNFHYGALQPPEVSGELANTRVFEILACGACQIVDRQGDVLRLFRDGEHLLGFSSGEELRARVEQALRDEDLARRVARAGQRAALERHTYAHRALHLMAPAVRDFPGDGQRGSGEATANAPRAAGGAR